jgi:hypothetical protein
MCSKGRALARTRGLARRLRGLFLEGLRKEPFCCAVTRARTAHMARPPQSPSRTLLPPQVLCLLFVPDEMLSSGKDWTGGYRHRTCGTARFRTAGLEPVSARHALPSPLFRARMGRRRGTGLMAAHTEMAGTAFKLPGWAALPRRPLNCEQRPLVGPADPLCQRRGQTWRAFARCAMRAAPAHSPAACVGIWCSNRQRAARSRSRRLRGAHEVKSRILDWTSRMEENGTRCSET